jgi:hypothetical protein
MFQGDMVGGSMADTQTKLCCRCKQTLPRDAFSRNRRHSTGLHSACKSCLSASRYSQKWRAGNRERAREYARQWNEENREANLVKLRQYLARTKGRRNENCKKWKQENPDKVVVYARRTWLKRYGLTLEHYEALSEQQGHKCAICASPRENERTGNLCVDHCHDSSVVRGLLCNDCNRNLVAQRNDPDIFLKAAEYVRQGLRKKIA